MSILDNFKQSLAAYYTTTNPNDKSYEVRYITSTITSAGTISISGLTPFMLIIDEAHNINNVDNVGFRVIFKLAKKAKRVLLLSATPITNYLNEMVALLLLMNPKLEQTIV